jgi:hypothetical protein
LRHRNAFAMKVPNPIKAITPIVAPTPIPAFAPADSSLLLVAIAVLVAECVDDAIEGEVDDEIAVGTGSPNRAAIVYRGIVLSSAQHRFKGPQHQVAESGEPVQGVTCTSLSLCEGSYSKSALLAYTDAMPCVHRLSKVPGTPLLPNYSSYTILARSILRSWSHTVRSAIGYPKKRSRLR